jgi:hypothetical protein
MLSHPFKALHPVFIDTYKLIFREWCDQLAYGWISSWARCFMFSTFVHWAFQRGSDHSEMDLNCKLGQGFAGFCCSKSCLTFSAVVRSYIVQMDHNAWKRFPRTLLTDAFHQIRNNRFDKEEWLKFHAFRNIQQTFDPCTTPNNRNETFFGLIFCFGISGRSSGFAVRHKWWKYSEKTAFLPC